MLLEPFDNRVSITLYIYFPPVIISASGFGPLRAAPVGGAPARGQVYDRRDPPAATAAVGGSASLKRRQGNALMASYRQHLVLVAGTNSYSAC